MNQVMLTGRLTNSPDCRLQNGTGKPTTKFSIAVERGYKTKNKEPIVDFIPCICFGKMAETVGTYLTKGMKVLLVGSWITSSYQNKDGYTIYTHTCQVKSFEFLEKHKRETVPDDVSNQSLPTSGFLDIDPDEDSELPFM